MEAYGVLVYGSGNCEIASALESEWDRLTKLEIPELALFGRCYLMENSCLAMYKRFAPLKEQIGQVKRGGVFELFNHQENKINKHIMKMDVSANEHSLEECLQIGIKRLEKEHYVLVMMGQSDTNGLCWDFAGEAPARLTYEAFSNVLYKLGKRNKVTFSLVLDVPIWHGVELPYMLAKHPYIESLFIYEREEPLKILPIARWLQDAFSSKRDLLEVLYEHYTGYQMMVEPIWWKFCKSRWEMYGQNPSTYMWKNFYEAYKRIVLYKAPLDIEHKIKVCFKVMNEKTYSPDIHYEELQNYLIELYHINESLVTIKNWYTELKTCIDYYKL